MEIRIEIDKKASAEYLDLVENPDKYFELPFSIALRRIGDEGRNRAGEMAPYKTGNLRRSITVSPMHGLPKKEVVVGTNLKYARIHDEGGTIYPKKGKYLRFQINGSWVSVKSVTIPKYKGRGYFTPMADEMLAGRAEQIVKEEFDAALGK